MPGRPAALVVLSAWVFAATVACEPENDNGVACEPADCAAACEALGFAGGACADGACACEPPGTDTYAWDASAGDDTDAPDAAPFRP